MEILLSQGKVAIIDDVDYPLIGTYKWHAYRDNNSFYTQAHDETGKTIYMHRLIMNAQRGERIDHIDGDGLNNRRSNLRKVTHKQNMQNRHAKPGALKGVGLTASGKWRARVASNGKEIHLGSFDDKNMAAIAYDRKAKEVFSEFACLNFTEEYTDAYIERRIMNAD